jgi:dihydrofolate reductase
MIVSLILARAQNSVIGKNNDIPWRLPADWSYFKKTTSHHHIIMGRKTFESLKKALPNRTNIIISRKTNYNPEDCFVFDDLQKALYFAKLNGEEECFIIGGAEIFKMALPVADRIYLTEIKAEVEGDTFFHALSKKEWKEISCTSHPKDDKNIYDMDFVLLEKKLD